MESERTSIRLVQYGRFVLIRRRYYGSDNQRRIDFFDREIYKRFHIYFRFRFRERCGSALYESAGQQLLFKRRHFHNGFIDCNKRVVLFLRQG